MEGFPTSDVTRHTGYVKSIRLLQLGSQKVLAFQPETTRFQTTATTTVIVCSQDELVMQELKTLCGSAFTTLTRALSAPYVALGGGQFERTLANMVGRLPADVIPATSKRESQLVHATLNCLTQSLEKVAQKLSPSPKAPAQGFVLDLLATKLSAIEHAVDAACTLSRIDSVLSEGHQS